MRSASSSSSSGFRASACRSTTTSCAPRSLAASRSPAICRDGADERRTVRSERHVGNMNIGPDDQPQGRGIAVVVGSDLAHRRPHADERVGRDADRDPAVGATRDAVEPGGRERCEQHRRRGLERLRFDRRRRDADEPAVVLHDVAGPDGVEDVEELVAPGAEVTLGYADGLVLVLGPAEAEPHVEPPMAEAVERRERAGEQHGRVPRARPGRWSRAARDP